MGKMLLLPRREDGAQDWINPPLFERPMPDFAARLHLWRHAWDERREAFRDDMHSICRWAAMGASDDGNDDGSGPAPLKGA